ncbi:hypothetical protein HDE_04377 [Halotydeus destructor]|nr:hypothetical protein HDE_04377 [Halotydeus destructor]
MAKLVIFRDRFLERVNGDYYVMDEIKKVMEDDDFILPFVEYSHDVDLAITALIKCLDMRKKLDIPNFKMSDLPVEYFQCGRFRLVKDVNGQLAFFDHSCFHRQFLKATPLWIKFVHHLVVDALSQQDGRQFDIYLDFSGVGYQCLDLSSAKQLIDFIMACFPCGMKSVNFIGLSSFLVPIAKTCLACLPKNLSNLLHFIDKQEMSVRFSDRLTHFKTPEGLSNIDTIGPRYGLEGKELLRFKKYLKWVQDEMAAKFDL